MTNKLICIVGETGTGKSASFRNLPLDKTFIINVKNKPLPFKGWDSTMLKDRVLASNNWKVIFDKIKEVNEDLSYKYLIIDDAGYIMSDEFLLKATEEGYNKFTEIGQHMFYIFERASRCRGDLHIIFTFHSEIIWSENLINRKIRTIGRILDEKYTIDGIFTILFYSITQSSDDKPVYRFITNRVAGYPAKSPMEMFEELYINNDLKSICDTIDAYYK